MIRSMENQSGESNSANEEMNERCIYKWSCSVVTDHNCLVNQKIRQ